MDLSPREAIDPRLPSPRRGKRWPALAVLGLVLAGGGVVVTKFLTSAIDYYCNVDELGVKSGCEAGRRLRVQGNVDEGSVSETNGVTSFTMSFNGVELPVRYEGEPGGIFQECVPVVVHGRLDESVAADGKVTRQFDGDQLEVKHDNEYVAKNGDRLAEAENACSLQA
ncbi:MAG: ccmE [Ilumatobacteraceae bacterium]|nr:ccmE [Ilumatobacteraceae bacterium]